MRAIVLFILFIGSPLMADLRFSEIFGVVTDRQGHPLPGADVIVTKNSGKKFVEVRRTMSDENGRYRVVMLESGEYDIRFSMGGFMDFTTCPITISPNKNKKINMTLIEAHIAFGVDYYCPHFSDLDPTSTTIGQTFTLDTLENLPLSRSSR